MGVDSRVIDLNKARVDLFVKAIRPRPEIRHQLDIGYSYDKGKFEIFEIRPIWNNPKEFRNYPFAKIRLVKSKMIWKLYWMRGSGNWMSYEPLPESNNLEELLECIDEDKYHCFKG